MSSVRFELDDVCVVVPTEPLPTLHARIVAAWNAKARGHWLEATPSGIRVRRPSLTEHPWSPPWSVLDVMADGSPESATEVEGFLERGPGLRRRVVVLRLRGPFDLSRHLPSADPDGDCTRCGKLFHAIDMDEKDLDECCLCGRLTLVVVAPCATPTRPSWVRAVRDACAWVRVPFAFAGWGRWVPLDQVPFDDTATRLLEGPFPRVSLDDTDFVLVGRDRGLRVLDGSLHEETPADLPAAVRRLWQDD